jgi:hypothetical protein
MIRTIYPHTDCPLSERRPTFSWTLKRVDPRLAKKLIYTLKVVALKEGQNAEKALARGRAVLTKENIRGTTAAYPRRAKSLQANQAYAYQVSAQTPDGEQAGLSNVGMFFVEAKGLPLNLKELTCCTGNKVSRSFRQWKTAYGEPAMSSRAQGCAGKQGVISLSGDAEKGDAVSQTLGTQIQAGKRYALSFCARMDPKVVDYIRFRVVAYNGSLPTSGHHPAPSAEVTIIGETSRITSTGWTRYLMPTWRANRMFARIAVLAISDAPGETTFGQIADVCLRESQRHDCGSFLDALDTEGKLDLPEGWSEYQTPGTEPQLEDVAYDEGSLLDMYGPHFDGAGNSNWYQENDLCVSVGGTVPPEAEARVKERDELDLGGGLTLADMGQAMEKIVETLGTGFGLDHLPPVPDDKAADCEDFRPDKRLPFGSRDVIYVQGFRPDHVIDLIVHRDSTGVLQSILGDAPDEEIDKRWPESRDSFEDGGFFKRAAESYWDAHIERHLGSVDQPSNRYLVVAWNSTQRLPDNVSAMLWQIAEAMNNGTGVVYNKKDPRGNTCFGREAVIISHSTGALLTNVAMSIAARTDSNSTLRKHFGNASYTAKRMRAHVSLHGAIGGSELADLALVGANLAGLAAGGVDAAVDVGISIANQGSVAIDLMKQGLAAFGISADAIANFFDAATDALVTLAQAAATTVNGSVLVDLSPFVAKTLWRPPMEANPVPVLTVAGGHPSNYGLFLATKFVLPGFDDGVVNTNSQSGSPTLLHPDLYAYFPTAARMYDMGIPPARAIPYFADQYEGPAMSAYGSSPWLSPTGMVQPVLTSASPLPRFRNHFTFLQGASDHNHPVQEDQDINDYISTLGTANYEESLVVDDPFVFDSGLVNDSILALVRGSVRGQDLVITLHFLVPAFSFVPPSYRFEELTLTITVPLWRRRYHLLRSSLDVSPEQDLQECDYVYRFVLR